MHKLARGVLAVHGLMCVVYGVLVALDLPGYAQYMGLAYVSDDGKAEVLTMYLGMGGALGLFFCFSSFTGKYLYEALLTLIISMKGVTYARIAAYLIFDTGDYILSALAYDVPLLALSLFCYWRLFVQKEPS